MGQRLDGTEVVDWTLGQLRPVTTRVEYQDMAPAAWRDDTRYPPAIGANGAAEGGVVEQPGQDRPGATLFMKDVHALAMGLLVATKVAKADGYQLKDWLELCQRAWEIHKPVRGREEDTGHDDAE